MNLSRVRVVLDKRGFYIKAFIFGAMTIGQVTKKAKTLVAKTFELRQEITYFLCPLVTKYNFPRQSLKRFTFRVKSSD